ncbi:hypothetical protein ISF_07230 [Cordyceps fumosorosea ARSEF 2679]|uniref:Utp8 beta-propeller domain-containing protein n=1 Tax=Cordyceps fumosorosea (strain ARSEF 2679) TaxID=1081104 RepID=A0A167Q5E4_CORFA|nr:hypothetical protein ISF_07230 [Cordyceps fumosorosea ARSEF 2679]OAA57309.1 hypothetical protein ISF_07230 [Cordyceps fumosorosea ARSEF 2679]
MAAEYKIHRPFTLAVLPRPLDHTRGNIFAREVYGQKDGSRKRKRTELVVGIDGENASIYDVPTSRQITSYPIPPQESFTCAPYSVRIRTASSSDISRYTYAVMSSKATQKITLFKDVVSADGKTVSTTTSQALKSSPVKYITCSSMPSQQSSVGDVILVCKSGEVISLSSETLSTNWTSFAKSPLQDTVATKISELEIEHVTSGSLNEFTDGLLKNKPEICSALPKSVEAGEPELLALVTRSRTKKQTLRHLIVLAAMRGSVSDIDLVPLEISPIPSHDTKEAVALSQIDIPTATLFQLQNSSLTIFDLSGAIPKPKLTLNTEAATSFTKLSRPFVVSSSLETITLFNYQYGSIHAKVKLDLSELPVESQRPRSCQFLSYVRSQDIAVALVDNVLVSIHVEPPTSHRKRHREGMLIDSIGRGTTLEATPKRAKHSKSAEFSRYIPGTMTESYMADHRAELSKADELLLNNEQEKWEELLREKFHVAHSGKIGADSKVSEEGGEWCWHNDGSKYAAVDRRWVIYALGQVFSLEANSSDDMTQHLRLVLPDSNVTTYLVVAGHMTMSNLRSTFVEELNGVDDREIATDLISCITDAEPSMSLLLNYLQATKLGETELILAIRALMLSMDLIPDTRKMNSTKLLTQQPHESGDKYEMDLDDLEREIALTEHYLGDDSSSRSRGLTLAFSKLWRQPAITTVKALRTSVRTEEILAFIYLLRMELVRGAWTSLYVDSTGPDSEGNESPPDGVITLIADLLGRCVDAIGSGGWLLNDTMAWADKSETGDFLTALKLEVTAALEGIEEAVHINGVVSEAVRYGQAVQKSGVGRQVSRTGSKPMTIQLENQEARMLPLGLKAKMLPTKEKIVSGGEVVQRSVRETGHLISQKVDAYSVEKLAI